MNSRASSAYSEAVVDHEPIKSNVMQATRETLLRGMFQLQRRNINPLFFLNVPPFLLLLLFNRQNMASTEGYSAIPREDADRQSDTGSAAAQQSTSDPITPLPAASEASPLAKLKRWWIQHWGSSESEHAPLINRHRMTLEAPRKSPLRVGIEITVIVGIFVLVATAILLSVGTSDNPRGE